MVDEVLSDSLNTLNVEYKRLRTKEEMEMFMKE